MNLNIQCFFILVLTLSAFLVYSQPKSSQLQQTQARLHTLQSQIGQLQKNLAQAQDRRGLLNHELEGIEKKNSIAIQKLHQIESAINLKTKEIMLLEHRSKQLEEQLEAQQHLLAKQIRSYYLMGKYQSLKWLINQKEPSHLSRYLTYYQYLINARRENIVRVQEIHDQITKNNSQLHQQIAEQKNLQHALATEHEQLLINKQYHSKIIATLDADIQTKQHRLVEIKRNKANLTALTVQLAQKTMNKPVTSFNSLRKKMPYPIAGNTHSYRRIHQGIAFFAEEGTAVSAVQAGTVVFSDWLKGYGLLIIIDHGDGYMTLYAHNQSLYKKKGDYVRQSEQIASVGHTGGIKQNGLYFEIRLKGKAISPLAWLS
ncbi:MAG: hypothetical protein BGO90_01545 [Legionella sp. 40-6]|nr:peptidoglycan DD-metalloendopeptidase family protein [Legionella sp.]OJX91057.1 MAG: hypothetical protein BGO90_01545 [Legionella sp. 40-6]